MAQAYTKEEVSSAIQQLQKDWINIDDKLIQLHIHCTTFDESISFVNYVAKLATAADHHPDIHIHYNAVVIELATHDVDGLTVKDFSLAKKIEQIL